MLFDPARHEPLEWDEWERCIANTIRRSASREGQLANWRAWLHSTDSGAPLVQFCHGAPGFVTCLAGMPGPSLDELQFEADAARYGGLRYSLWTGDPGFALYLWDCIRGAAAFPTLDVFFAPRPAP